MEVIRSFACLLTFLSSYLLYVASWQTGTEMKRSDLVLQKAEIKGLQFTAGNSET
jgi:hypothetical protein